MKVLAITFARSLSDINPEVLDALDNQDYEDYEVLIHTQKAGNFNFDPHKNKSLNAAHHRNVIKKMVLNTDFDWFLWVDSDTVIPPNTIKDLMATEKKLVGGWYKKIRNDDWVAGNWTPSGVMKFFKEPQDGLIKVDFLGLGCCLVHRSLMEKLDWSGGTEEYMQDENGNTYYLGNCIVYSEDAKNLGFDSFMLGSVVCEHLNRKEVY